MGFKSEWFHTIDEKGRISIPSKLRAYLGDKVVIIRFYKNFLFLFPANEWNKFDKKLSEIPTITDEKALSFRRLILRESADCSIDRAGRITIPSNLKEELNLKGEVVINGNGPVIEIWNKETYLKQIEDAEKNREELISYAKSIGL